MRALRQFGVCSLACFALAQPAYAAPPQAAAPASPAAVAPASPAEVAPAPASPSAAAPPVAAPARAADVEVQVGAGRYAAARGETWVSVYAGTGTVSTMTMPCRVSALGASSPHLYVGCDDGQVRIFAVDGARAGAPVQVGAYAYPGPVRAFVIRDGQLFVDAAPAAPPAAAPPSANPPAPTVGAQGPAASSLPGRNRDAEFAAAFQNQQARRKLNRSHDLMWGGFGVALVSYGFTAFYGSAIASFDNRGLWYVVPVVGPFVAATNSFVPGLDVLMGVAQLGGVVIGGIGAGIYLREKRRLTLSNMAVRHGAGAQLRFEF